MPGTTLSTSYASFAAPPPPRRSSSSPSIMPPFSPTTTPLAANSDPVTLPTHIRAFLSLHWSRYVLVITDPDSLLSRIFVFVNLSVWLYLNWVTLREAREGRSSWGWVAGTGLALGLTGFNGWETWRGISESAKRRARGRARRVARRRDTEDRVGGTEQETLIDTLLMGEKSD